MVSIHDLPSTDEDGLSYDPVPSEYRREKHVVYPERFDEDGTPEEGWVPDNNNIEDKEDLTAESLVPPANGEEYIYANPTENDLLVPRRRDIMNNLPFPKLEVIIINREKLIDAVEEAINQSGFNEKDIEGIDWVGWFAKFLNRKALNNRDNSQHKHIASPFEGNITFGVIAEKKNAYDSEYSESVLNIDNDEPTKDVEKDQKIAAIRAEWRKAYDKLSDEFEKQAIWNYYQINEKVIGTIGTEEQYIKNHLSRDQVKG